MKPWGAMLQHDDDDDDDDDDEHFNKQNKSF